MGNQIFALWLKNDRVRDDGSCNIHKTGKKNLFYIFNTIKQNCVLFLL